MQSIASSATVPGVLQVRPLDRTAAALFLRAQASWLRRGLALVDDAIEVGVVLRTHDASHEAWVDTIAAVERALGGEAAQKLALLYGFHGRVAGSLERGVALFVDEDVRAQVRRMLAERLTALTEEAVANLAA
jgi:hypothetical protein